MYTRAFQNEVDVGKLTGHSIFPLFGSIEVHWYHFRRNPTIFRKAHGLQSFRVFYPILANFDHKATYRRQTINILLRHVGLLWLLVPSWKHFIFEKPKFPKKNFWFIFLTFEKYLKNPKINVLIYIFIEAVYMSLYLSGTVFRSKIGYNLSS